MPTGYKIAEQDQIYHLTLQVVEWVDLFTSQLRSLTDFSAVEGGKVEDGRQEVVVQGNGKQGDGIR